MKAVRRAEAGMEMMRQLEVNGPDATWIKPSRSTMSKKEPPKH